MLLRLLFILFSLILCAPSAIAADCLDVFPSGWRENTPADERLINFPSNVSGATLTDGTTLPHGDNLYNNSSLGNNDEVFVSAFSGSETTARLFFRSSVSWQNVKINENGNPEDLIIVIDGGLQITGGSTVINAIIYVKGTTSVNGNPTINGAAATVGSSSNFNVNYSANYISNADFNGMCDNTPVIPAQVLANYRFDECEYTGVALEVFDQTGNYSATSFSGVNTFESGQIERAAELTNVSHHFETSIPLTANFSVSTWFKKPTSNANSQYFVLGAMESGGDLLYLDRNNNWRWGVYNSSTGAVNGSFSFASLDDNWHHMALVYSGGETKLYIDGTLTDTVNRVPDGTLKYIGTSFDGVSGSNSQAFRAPLDEFMVFDGALTPMEVSDIYANQNAENNYDGSSRDSVICLNPSTEYRFDETEYTDTPDEIIDSIGGFHGQAKNSQPVEGKVCNAIDLSTGGTSDYAVLDKDILTGKTDFTISLWSQTSKTSNQSILSGAGNTNNELIMWFTNHTNFRPYLKNAQNGVITTPSIADDNWQHIVWTREGSQNCLFVDKQLRGCVSLTTLPLDIQSLILGQEQDSVGGGFSSSQAFDGLLDEFLVFDSAISSDDIAIIYDNQNAGLGYDGSTRDCPVPVFPSPVLDLHFDELNWDADDSIIDISGNDYHANAVNVTPTEGFICKAADLSATGIDDYIVLDSEALNNRSNFSISLWYQTPKTGTQSIISGSSISNLNELIFWFTNNTLFRPFIKGGSQSIVTEDVSDNVWHHLVWTRSGSRNLFYRDGVLQPGSAILSTGALNITSLILGQEQDSLGGTFDASQSVEGLVDELLIFEKALTAEQVLTVFDNESAGLNYDGTPRDCPTPPTTILNMQFDESSWSGAVGEVIDETGNFNGQSKNGADTAQSSPAIVGNPGTCGYGTFDGVNDYVALPASFENQQGSFTITAWINPSNLQIGSRIFADDENNTQGYAFSLGDPGSGKLRFYSRGVSPISVDTLSAVISANTWTFVTAVHNLDTKTREIYVNGVAQTVTGGGTSNTYTNTWGVDTGIASIGGETDSGETANRFTGAIDEVRMYDSALSRAEIEEVYRETHPCDNFIDHFEIIHDGQGLTCEAENITVRACANASCSTLNSDATDVQLSINGTFDKTITIVGGSTNTNFSYTNTGTATLSLDQTYECKNGSSSSCNVVFSDTGFRFYENTETNPIPTQVSAKPSNTLKIQAIEKNPDTGACQATFIDTTEVEMAATCVDPIACAGSQVAINNLTATGNINTLNKNSVLSYSSVNLDFSDDTVNSAGFIFTYPDAGKIQLHARYNIPDENGDPSGNYMLGSSNEFVVRPFGFFIDVVGNPNPRAKTAAGTKFIAAGEEFSTVLKAVQWQVDNDTDLSNNPITKNFGNEQAPETAKISPNMVLPNLSTLPSAGVLGNLTNVTFDTFSAGSSAEKGIATNDDMTYSEVGIISFSANLTDNSYLGADDVVGNEPYVGRFIPDHFILNKTDGSLVTICDIGSPKPMLFAYSGQMSSATPSTGGAIRYSENPSFTITAKSVGAENTTLNYTGDFMKLVGDSVVRKIIVDGTSTFFAPIKDGSADGSLGTKLTLTSDLKVVTTASLKNNEANGVVTYTYENADNFAYHHVKNAEVKKFTADINLPIVSIIDSDDVTAKDADGDFDNDGDLSNALDSVLTLEPTGVEIRFGRAQLENSYGPDTSDLPQTLSIHYYTENGYVLSDTDTCTTFNSDNITLTDMSLGIGKTDIKEDVSGDFFNEIPKGETRKIILTAPTTDPSNVNTGQVKVIYDISDWLKYDWGYDDEGVDGLYDDNPRAVATFGIYRGNDRIIYQREISR
jgi:MSHA biogenesis protein MshQ